MTKFNDQINSLMVRPIFDSVVNIPRNSLDPTVWQFFDDGRLPILQDSIKKQIGIDVRRIETLVPVLNFYIIGSIVTKQYGEKSDIDVDIQVDPIDLNEVGTAELLSMIKKIKGKNALGTTHPINYFIITNDFDFDKAEGVYDVANEKWIKSPEEISPDIQSFLLKMTSTFQDIDIATGLLRRNLMDMNELRHLKTHDIKRLHSLITKKLEEVEISMKDLVNTYEDINYIRKMAFDRVMTPEEIRVFGHKNRLPENVIYKMLEKYYYVDLMKQLRDILEDKEKISLKDIKDIQKSTKEFWA